MECYITYCIKGFLAFDSANNLIAKIEDVKVDVECWK